MEGVGNRTCIASDKTSTLTVNQQIIQTIWLPRGEDFQVTGEGYRGDGLVLEARGRTPEAAIGVRTGPSGDGQQPVVILNRSALAGWTIRAFSTPAFPCRQRSGNLKQA